MWITRTSINNPVFATMMMVALCVLGIFSYNRLRVERMPDITIPFVFIQVAYPGAAPEAVENDITKPVEEVVNTVNGVKVIRSNSWEGRSETYIEFRLDTDMDRAVQDIRDKVAAVRPSWPRESRDPLILRGDFDNAQPIVFLAVTSPTRTLRELTTFTDQVIVKRFQNVPGVGQVRVNGGVARQIQVRLKPAQMQSQGVGVDEVIAAIRAANMDVPAGRVTQGPVEQLVRIEGRIKEPAAFGKVIVARRARGPVHLEQVAEVMDGEREADSLSRINGQPGLTIEILKVQDANVVEVGKGAKAAVEALKKSLPPDVKVQIVYADVDFIEKALNGVKTTIVEGALLTIFIVFLFLHSWRSTIITGLTLPISVIATFVAVYLFGFTLNFLTLMALSLCIGLLIDDAIVVRENIVRHLGMGKDHYRAAREGTDEIGLAVMATTFAIVAVFIPVAFMSGIIGKFFFQFGITVAVAVLVSLFVSFTLDPMLSAIWRDPPGSRFSKVPWLGRVMDRIEDGVEWAHHRYGELLEWSLGNRKKVLAIAVAVFVSSFFVLPLVGTEMMPESDEGRTSFRLTMPVGSSLEYTDAKVRQVEEILRGYKEVEVTIANVGTGEGRNIARVEVRLADRHAVARRGVKDFEAEVRKKIQAIPGIELSVGYNRPIWINLLGPNNDELERQTALVMEKIAKVKGLVDLESSLKANNPAITIKIDNELASDLGLTVQQIGSAVRPFVAGDVIGHWLAPDGQNYEVNVQLPKSGRRIASDLGDLYVVSSRPGADGNPILVPLRQVAEFQNSTSPQIIKRQELQRRVGIYANVEGRPSGDAGREVQELLKTIELPPGYRFDVAGQTQEMEESFAAAMAALAMAVIFIYIILASQFGSFLQPLAIMASLPFTLIGVFLALLVTGSTLNIFSIIGIIMLMGLVTKNAILLVDFTNQGLKAGKSRHDAILDAGQVRLRPILMTTMAMIFGMLPMAIGSADGGEQNAPMGRAVIGGIITSTLLTLVVVPVLYTYLDALGRRVSGRLARKHGDGEAADAAPQQGD